VLAHFIQQFIHVILRKIFLASLKIPGVFSASWAFSNASQKAGIGFFVGLVLFINARLCHERPARAGAADEARTNIGRRAAHLDSFK
jgi:hypothetical protein